MITRCGGDQARAAALRPEDEGRLTAAVADVVDAAADAAA